MCTSTTYLCTVCERTSTRPPTLYASAEETGPACKSPGSYNKHQKVETACRGRCEETILARYAHEKKFESSQEREVEKKAVVGVAIKATGPVEDQKGAELEPVEKVEVKQGEAGGDSGEVSTWEVVEPDTGSERVGPTGCNEKGHWKT